MGMLSIASALQPDDKVVTFDLVPWDSVNQTWLRKTDGACHSESR